ncbi:MAG: hypothetical protein M3203_17295 [Actinomycetota bacterium]|nr:hypothetical protein [Actinomycetota bacterium]
MYVGLLVAAMPWTYWMAIPILVSTALLLLGFALVYLKKVVEPNVLRQDALEAARRNPALAPSAQPASLRSVFRLRTVVEANP